MGRDGKSGVGENAKFSPAKMVGQLTDDGAKHPRLRSLPKHLHRRGVVPGEQRVAVEALDLGLPQ